MNLAAFVLLVILPALSLALVLTFVRLLRGPSLPDRVIALDMLAVLSIGVVAAYAVATGQPALLDVALLLALLAFLGTVGFAWYIENSRDSRAGGAKNHTSQFPVRKLHGGTNDRPV